MDATDLGRLQDERNEQESVSNKSRKIKMGPTDLGCCRNMPKNEPEKKGRGSKKRDACAFRTFPFRALTRVPH